MGTWLWFRNRYTISTSTTSFRKVVRISLVKSNFSEHRCYQYYRFHQGKPCRVFSRLDVSKESRRNLCLPSEEKVDVSESSMETSLVEREIDSDADENLSHLRTKLYSSELDETGVLNKLYDVASVQDVLDIMGELDNPTPIQSSQALVTLWDLQKLLFSLGPYFTPEEDISNKLTFVEAIKNNQIFKKKILEPTMENFRELEDEPLCAALLSLKKMSFPLTFMEPLLMECYKRKNTLCLSGLSRLSVCLRIEGLYGQILSAEFLPLLETYAKTMESDIDVRLVSIALRNSSRVLPSNTKHIYMSRIREFLNSEKMESWETVTLIKVFIALHECGDAAEDLIHFVGSLLAPRVPQMEIMEIFSLQKILQNFAMEPLNLAQALVEMNLRLLEEEKDQPRLDILAATASYVKDFRTSTKLIQLVKNYLNSRKVSAAHHVLFSTLRNLKVFDHSSYDKYWNYIMSELNFDSETDHDVHKIIQNAKKYLNFVIGLNFKYRHIWLETCCRKALHGYLRDYPKTSRKFVLGPSDLAIIMSFLLTFDKYFVDLSCLSAFNNFASQYNAFDLYLLSKGVHCALRNPKISKKTLEVVIQVSSVLEEESGLRILSSVEDITSPDVTLTCRLLGILRKIKNDTPLLNMLMEAFFNKKSYVSYEVREVCHVLSNSNFNFPHALPLLSNYLRSRINYVSLDTIERFLNLTYIMGWELEDKEFASAIAAVIEENWRKIGIGIINSAIALGFHRKLSVELINNIFNVDFLDCIEEELHTTHNQNSMMYRKALMKLNRLVCLDIPDSRLPFFHEKFCVSLLSKGQISSHKPQYINAEVATILSSLIQGEGVVQRDVCLSQDYFYYIDFVLEFDDLGHPIRRNQKKSIFSIVRSQKEAVVAHRKVAILILDDGAFTKNVRSLKGGFQLKRRHLEILGYDVITIDPHHWNSMYMSENAMKENFLENKIFAS